MRLFAFEVFTAFERNYFIYSTSPTVSLRDLANAPTCEVFGGMLKREDVRKMAKSGADILNKIRTGIFEVLEAVFLLRHL